MKRTVRESLQTSDKAFTVLYYDDGSILVKPRKQSVSARISSMDPQAGYYTAQGIILLAVDQGKIFTSSDLLDKAREVGWANTKLHGYGYIKLINGRYYLTRKGRERLNWIKQHTWADVI